MNYPLFNLFVQFTPYSVRSRAGVKQMVGVGVAYEGPYEGTPFGAGVTYEAGAPIVRRLGSTDRFKIWNVLCSIWRKPVHVGLASRDSESFRSLLSADRLAPGPAAVPSELHADRVHP